MFNAKLQDKTDKMWWCTQVESVYQGRVQGGRLGCSPP